MVLINAAIASGLMLGTWAFLDWVFDRVHSLSEYAVEFLTMFVGAFAALMLFS